MPQWTSHTLVGLPQNAWLRQRDGYVEHRLRASSTCLVVVDRNRYSVPAAFVGRAASVRSTANSVRIVAEGAVIAEHARRFGRDQLICDP